MNNFIITLSGGSTTGKTTISKRIIDKYDFIMFKPKTTRDKRPNEFYSDYVHISESEFLKDIENGNFVFWDYLFGNYYGIPKNIEYFLNNNLKCIFIIPSWRMEDLLKNFDTKCISFHLISASPKKVINRLGNRSSLSSEELNQRLKDLKTQDEVILQNAIRINGELPMDEIYQIIDLNIEKMLNDRK